MGEEDKLGPGLVTMVANLKPLLKGRLVKKLEKFLGPWTTMDYDTLQYLSIMYTGEEEDDEKKVPSEVVNLKALWPMFTVEAAEKTLQLLNRFDLTRAQIHSYETTGKVLPKVVPTIVVIRQ